MKKSLFTKKRVLIAPQRYGKYFHLQNIYQNIFPIITSFAAFHSFTPMVAYNNPLSVYPVYNRLSRL